MNISISKLDFNNELLINKILEWRNDETTRLNSVNSNIINTETFTHILNKYKQCIIPPYIININNIPVGIFTFVESDNKIFIGININPNNRDQHIGDKSFCLIISELKKYCCNIYAKVKKNNIPSIKLFSKYFTYISQDDNYILFICCNNSS